MGKPSWLKTSYPLAEYIGLGRLTQGTETSQYLEEEKSIQRFPK
jgi:hypothetical protein